MSHTAALKRALGYLAAIAAIVVVWALLSYAIGSPALPMPLAAVQSFITNLPEIVPEALISLYRIVVAMAAGMILALPIGLWLGRSKRTDTFFAPLLYVLYPIPKVVFLPVLMVLFGLGDLPKVLLIGIVIFFQTLVTARDAARNIEEGHVVSVRSLGASPWQIARHVVLPASLPDVFTALRINTGTAIAILFLAESIAGSSGLGYYIVNAWSFLDYAAMFGGIIAMALLGVILYEALNVVERRLLRWKRVKA